MTLKFITENDNVFDLLGTSSPDPLPGFRPGPRWGLPSPDPLACAVLKFPLKSHASNSDAEYSKCTDYLLNIARVD